MTSVRLQLTPVVLAVAASFALGILATLLLWIAYPYGLITPDSYDYLRAGETMLHPTAALYDKSRGPLLPLLLALLTHTPFPGALLLWINGILFSLAIAAAAWTGTLVFKKAEAGFLLAFILLATELLLNQPFFYAAFALTDGPAAYLLFAGTLLATGGWWQKSKAALIGGFLCLGLSEAFRPMLLIAALWGCAGIGMWLYCNKRGVQKSILALCLAVLLLPIGIWNIRNAIVYKNTEPSLMGAHLLSHAATLWTDDEKVIDDPVANSILLAKRWSTDLPPPYDGPRVFGLLPHPSDSAVRFFASQTPTYKAEGWQPARIPAEIYRQETLILLLPVSIHTIIRHPFGYARQVLIGYAELYDRHKNEDYLQSFLTAKAKETYDRLWQIQIIPESLKETFLKRERSDPLRTAAFASSILWSLALPIQWPEVMRQLFLPFILLVHACGLLGCMLAFSPVMRKHLGVQERTGKIFAVLMATLFFTTAIPALFVASITRMLETRYAAPGMMPSHFLLLLAAGMLLSKITDNWKNRSSTK